MRTVFAVVLALGFAPMAVAAPTAPAFSNAAPARSAPADPLLNGQVRLAVRQETLPAGGKLPEHRQDALRYLYVVSGRLKVSDLVTGDEQVVEAGKMATEAAGDWHVAEALGSAPVTLYVIDQAPQAAN